MRKPAKLRVKKVWAQKTPPLKKSKKNQKKTGKMNFFDPIQPILLTVLQCYIQPSEMAFFILFTSIPQK